LTLIGQDFVLPMVSAICYAVSFLMHSVDHLS
jgi:hypothetical protein